MPGGLSTDLYELTMAAGYHAAGEMPRASFELFVRALPPSRGFLVAAGVEQALEYLESWRYTPDDVAYLRRLPALAGVSPRFFDDYLSRLRFSGDVWAVDEGGAGVRGRAAGAGHRAGGGRRSSWRPPCSRRSSSRP